MNKIPDNIDLWPTSHPMTFEVNACLKPIIHAETVMRIEDLQERMQERGAFMLRVEEHENPSLWKLLFLLDTRFYCDVVIYSGDTIPEPVLQLFGIERNRRESETKISDTISDKDNRNRILEARSESLLRDGEKTDEQSEDEAEEARLEEEERNARDANFQLKGVRGLVYDYSLYVVKPA